MALELINEGGASLYVASGEAGVLGYVAIDSEIAGRSCGGLRMLEDVTPDEIRMLARAMTLKYGLLALPQGGAKAGVLGDPDAPARERFERLRAFGRAIAPLLCSRRYVPGVDMGTTATDVRDMLRSAGVPVASRDLRETASGFYTAVSVMAGVSQAACRIGLDLSGSTAAVEGFGKVGSALAGLLAGSGVKVVAISTSRGALYNPRGLNIERLQRTAAEEGSSVVEVCRDGELMKRSALLELPLDVLCPCARGGSIDPTNAGRVQAKILSTGANNAVRPEAEEILRARGVLCLPDFVTNCGDVLGGTMEFASMRPSAVAAFVDRAVRAIVLWTLDESDHTGSAPQAVAEALALSRFASVKAAAEHPTLGAKVFSAGLSLYRRGLIPAALVRWKARGYFERLLAESPYGGG